MNDLLAALRAAGWPEGSGVYIVRKRNIEAPKSIFYIGKTGKLKADSVDEVLLNGGSLQKRFSRSTPYCFQGNGPYKNHFEYGPNFCAKQKLKDLPYEDRYRSHVPLAEIEVVTFSTAGIEKQVSPALLESLFLTAYVANEGCLPPANQEL